jgi:subtilase family serine protease
LYQKGKIPSGGRTKGKNWKKQANNKTPVIAALADEPASVHSSCRRIPMFKSRRVALCFFLVAVLSFSFATGSQQNLQRLHGHVAPAVSKGQVRPLRAMSHQQTLHFSLVLPMRNGAQLDQLLSRLYNPGSPDYRHFLSVEEFTDQFGPTEQDYQAVVDFAAANGFTVDRRPANRVVVPLSGTAEQVERALGVRMNVYQHPTESRTFFSPDREPSLQLSVPVLHIAGLDDFYLPKPMVVKPEAAQGRAAASRAAVRGSGPGNSYLGSDMRAAYYGGNTLTGAGQTVALFQMDGYFKEDVDLTFASAGQSYSVPIVNVLLDGVDGNLSQTEDAEQVLDIVQTISMAPGLDQVRVYIGRYPIDVLNEIASEDVAKQVSISWAWYGTDPTPENQVFKEMAAQGQNVFAASGDYGSFAGGYQWGFPSEDPWVTAVGGTTLTTQAAGGAYGSEVAWQRSGGGISPSKYPQPTWQAGTATAANGGSATLRNVPDVAMEADFDNYLCSMSNCQGSWAGTSYAAPRWAGLMALVNEQASLAGSKAPGFINAAIYDLGKAAGGQFHDVTSGSNPSSTDHSVSF